MRVSPSLSSSPKIGESSCLTRKSCALGSSTTRVVRLDARPLAILGSTQIDVRILRSGLQ